METIDLKNVTKLKVVEVKANKLFKPSVYVTCDTLFDDQAILHILVVYADKSEFTTINYLFKK